MYEMGRGIEKDTAKTCEIYEKLAAKGDPDAVYSLGILYENGKGVEKDVKKAIEQYQQAAEKGLHDAWYAIGECIDLKKE